MKKTNKSVIGTSFHNTTIKATVRELVKLIGTPVCEDNNGEDKVNFEWEVETNNEKVATIYDWKYYRPLSKDEIIEWHIGSHDEFTAIEAKDELEIMLEALKSSAV